MNCFQQLTLLLLQQGPEARPTSRIHARRLISEFNEEIQGMAREGLMSCTTASLLCHRLRELSIAVASATQADTRPRNNLIMGRLGRFQFNFWKFFPSDEDPDDEDPGTLS